MTAASHALPAARSPRTASRAGRGRFARFLFLAAAPLLLSRPVPAQTVSFKISPPAAKPRLAEPFLLRLELTCPAGYTVTPDTGAFSNEVFELLGIKKDSSGTSGQSATETFDLRVSAFAIGVSSFPETTWLLAKGAEVKEAKSPPFPVDILPLFDEKTEPEGIRDIRPPFRFIPWLWLLAGLLAAALAARFLYLRYAARSASAAKDEVPPDTRSPYEKAAGALTELAASGLWREGRIKEFYSRLSDIFRLYLDGQFGIKAELMTTNNITKELRRTGADIQTVIRTRELLEKADLVKFARLKPEEKDHDADISALRDLLLFYVQKTENKPSAETGETRP